MTARQEFLRTAKAQLVACLQMYEADAGGRRGPAYLGWGCPCLPGQPEGVAGWDGFPLIGDDPLMPGEQRRVGFWFLSGEEAASAIREAGRFYLWEGRIVGEGQVIE